MTIFVIVLSLICIAVSLYNWRVGLILVVAVGILQDPLRKLAPDHSIYYTLWAAAMFMFVSLSSFSTRGHGGFNDLFLYDIRLKRSWTIYLTIVAVQILHGLLRWQSVQASVLGSLFYIGPVIALLVAFGYANSEKAILRFINAYIVLTVPVVATVYLSEAYSEEWTVLKDIGTLTGAELIIYDVGRALKSYSGLFRVGEIAAWHAATCCMFLTILITKSQSLTKNLIMGLLILMLVGAILLTGRRKMLMTLTIFLVLHWALLSLYLRSSIRLAVVIILVGAIGLIGLSGLKETSTTSIYLERGKTVYEDAGERLNLSYNSSLSAVSTSAGIGLGVGVTSQGGRYLSQSGANNLSWASEFGLGKIALELGIPGAIFLGYLVLSIVMRISANFKLLTAVNRRLLIYSVSFSSMLFANAVTFLVATQVYGDLYILVVLGIIAGMLFSVNAKGTAMYFARASRYRNQPRVEYASGLQTPTRAGPA